MPRKAPLLSEDFIPIGEFKTHASKFLRRLKARGRPLVITQHGRAAAVLMQPADYDYMGKRDRVVGAIQAGMDDVRAGRTLSDEELDRELDKEFGPLKRKR